ncbi:MAG: DUF479 domain-containing protein [Acidobacteria bacterium]|nr:DUF479 domain-containing protein [Acidobacteriota bacterium]
MNFLAHILTGDSGEAMMVGSFAGDFCRGRLEKHPDRLRAGIRLHRMVDAFAEDHRSFSAVRALLRPSLGLYSAVGADMLIDHLLALEWERWLPGEPLPAFADRVGAVLAGNSQWLPENARRIARMMILGGWLESYAREDGIRTALEKMSMRTRGNVRLSDAMDELDRSRSEIFAAARDFLGDLFSSTTMIDAGMRGDLSTVMR